MIRRRGPITTLGLLLVIMAGTLFLAGCGGGSSGGGSTTPTTTPAASLSTASLTYTSQSVGTPTSPQAVTLNSTGTAALVLSSITITGTNAGDFSQTNNCGTGVNAGSSCTINVIFTPSGAGTRTATLTVTDNATPSTQTATLTGTGAASTVSLSGSSVTFTLQTMVGSATPAQTVTLNNTGTAALSISSVTITGTNAADFSQTDNCGSSVSAAGNCAINITFTPTAAGTRTGTLTITDNSNGVAGTMQMVTLTGIGFSSNTAAVSVNFGPNNYTGPVTATSASYYDGIFTTVAVCAPGTSTCQQIPNVLVDTGSVGLRVLSNQLGSVTLPNITDTSGDILYECVQYGDLSYTWGPMEMATVQVGGAGGETAAQIPSANANSGIPIQVITVGGAAPSGASCASGGGPSDNSVAALGANGILGVGNYAQDCGNGCTSSTTTVSPYPYILCTSTGSQCGYTTVPLNLQAWNPVSAFASADTNGVILQLPSIPAAGQVSAAGSLVFGIGTQTCSGAPSTCTANALSGANVYALDGYGNFPNTQLNGITYNINNDAGYGAFLDSGSNSLYISDATTLGTTDCYVGGTAAANDTGYYCPATSGTPSTLALSNFTLTDNNGVSTPALGLTIGNALSLFAANPTFAAFNDIGGDSGTGATTDYFDLGLPFFFGRNVYVGIMGTTAPNNVSVPNGYWAF